VKLNETTRDALACVALADLGIGLILVDPRMGLGPFSMNLRGITGWALMITAVLFALQAALGRLHRWGQALLGINIVLVAVAAYLLLVTGNLHRPAATVGHVVLVVAVAIAITLIWARLTGRRLGRHSGPGGG
jgi:hypothetical protein